jgi:hypothetical protein
MTPPPIQFVLDTMFYILKKMLLLVSHIMLEKSMDKGKGLFSGLSSRINSKVSINLDDEHQREDDMISKAEGLGVHTTRWQDPGMLSVLHIKEYFNQFLNQTRLGGFASCPQKTYAEISRDFLATFRFGIIMSYNILFVNYVQGVT